MEAVNTFLSYIVNLDEITNCMHTIDSHFEQVLKKCCSASIETEATQVISKRFTVDIETVLDFLHDELNTGHWSQVPLCVRQAFTGATFVKVITQLRSYEKLSSDVVKVILKSIDMGLLLGAPLNENCDILNQCATFLNKKLTSLETPIVSEKTKKALKRKNSNNYSQACEKLAARNIDVLQCPSVEHFNKTYFEQQVPVKLQGKLF